MDKKDAFVKDMQKAALHGPKVNMLAAMLAVKDGSNGSGKGDMLTLCAALAWGLFVRNQTKSAKAFGELFGATIETLASIYEEGFEKVKADPLLAAEIVTRDDYMSVMTNMK